MSLDKLSDEDREVVRSCLVALRDGPFQCEREFQATVGLTKAYLASVLASWDTVDDSDDDRDVALLLDNCLNNVANGIRFSDEEWVRYFKVDRSTVRRVFRWWRELRGWE